MNRIKYFSMAALALIAVACGVDDNTLPGQAPLPSAEGIPFTATISSDAPTTRALTENGDNIDAKWATGDNLMLRYLVNGEYKTTMASVTAVDETTGTATISATLNSEVTDGTAVSIGYPYGAIYYSTDKGDFTTRYIKDQNGNFAQVSNLNDLRTGTGTIKVQDGTSSLKGTTTLYNRNAIVKFRLTDGTDSIKALNLWVYDGTGTTLIAQATRTGSETQPAISTFYMAIDPTTTTGGTFIFVADTGSKKYEKTAKGTLTAGKFYQTSLKMTARTYPIDLKDATVSDVGLVVASDAKVYPTISDAESAGTTASGMIAYISSIGHGLAFSLESIKDAQGTAGEDSITWDDAVAGAQAYSRARPTGYGNTVGDWHLPTKDEFDCLKSTDTGCRTTGGLIYMKGRQASSCGGTPLPNPSDLYYYIWTATDYPNSTTDAYGFYPGGNTWHSATKNVRKWPNGAARMARAVFAF